MVNPFKILILAEFIIAFMLSLVIALNSERLSAKVMSVALFILLFDVGLKVLGGVVYINPLSDIRTNLTDGEIILSNNVPELLSDVGLFLTYYFTDFTHMVLGLVFIVSFLVMLKDNLPVDVESLPPKEEKYYWK